MSEGRFAFVARLRASLGLLVVVLAGPLAAQAPDPFVGTWKLNVAKSRFSPWPPPMSQTVRIESVAEGRHKVTNDTVAADGRTAHTEYTAANDGKDYPMEGSFLVDTVSGKRIDARTVERTDKKGGKVVQTLRTQASADGKTLTVTIKATSAQGQAVNVTAVYERQ